MSKKPERISGIPEENEFFRKGGRRFQDIKTVFCRSKK
jgi:hypothetical protein